MKVVFGQSAGYGKKATQPCPCSYPGDTIKERTCSISTITRYRKRISGSLLDRLDIHVEVSRVEHDPVRAGREEAAGRPPGVGRTGDNQAS